MKKALKTVLEVLTLSTEYLKNRGITAPRRQSEELISDVLKLSRMDLYMQFERPLDEAELDFCRKNLMRLGKGEPYQYIREEVEFYGCRIKISKDVLIPRQETEILVDLIAKRLEIDQNLFGSLKGKVLFDVCTGSGCIPIALKKKFPELTVMASDISIQALSLAKENSEKNEVDITFLTGDLLRPFDGKKCDYFVSNPPYISEKEYEALGIEVKNFEPKIALLGGETGLEFYRKIAVELQGFLKNSAACFFEIGRGQGNSLMSLFSSEPWKNCRVLPDWSSQDRFFFLEIE